MGKKVFSARQILSGAIFDVNRILLSNCESSKTAFNILEKKMEEIRKIEQTPYMHLKWD